MSNGSGRWAYAREILFALAVIALTFLNFGHISVSAAGDIQITPDSWCGDAMAPEGTPHSPCHACRVDGAALPPPPVDATPVCFAVAIASYETPFAVAPAPLTQRSVQPRGPPALV
jgi:hypothetical protein